MRVLKNNLQFPKIVYYAILNILFNFFIMKQEKPGWWEIWYTVERAKQLAAEEAKKKEQEKLKNKVKWKIGELIKNK